MKDWGLNDIRTFKNFYLLRDFTYCDLYAKSSNSEIQINEKYLDYFKNVKEEFIQHPNSSMIFNDPNFNFDEASLPNKDGSQLIINQLQKVKSNSFKTDSILLKSEKAFKTVKQELEIYKKSDNEADRINEIKGQTNDVINRILALVNDDINVGFLTDQLSADENEIYHVVYAIVKNKDFGHVHSLRKYFSFFLQYPRLKELNSYKERIDYLAIELRKDQKETEAYLTDLGYDVELLLNQNVDVMEDKALYIANKAKSFWIENQLNIENFKSDKKALSSGFLQLIMPRSPLAGLEPVDAGGNALDQASAQHQLVARNFCVCGRFLQCRDEELRCFHGARAWVRSGRSRRCTDTCIGCGKPRVRAPHRAGAIIKSVNRSRSDYARP